MERFANNAYLVPVEGPSIAPISLATDGGHGTGLTLGRHPDCQLQLPVSAEQASRFHCNLRFDGARWKIADLSSRRGTFVNGVKLQPAQEMGLADGDLIRVDPWTFQLCRTADRRGMLSDDDGSMTIIHTMQNSPAASAALDADFLNLLLTASTSIYAAADERQLVESAVDAAVRGTGLTNAAVLRCLDSAGRVEILASRFGGKPDSAPVRFSRSLIAAAAGGQIAQVSSQNMPVGSNSIIEMKVTAALCVPLMLGPSTAFFLYLDSRSDHPHLPSSKTISAKAIAFVTTLGQLASLALANLKRIEMEQRQRSLDLEMQNAQAAQRWILPQRRIEIGPYICIGDSKPGQSLSGDFFEWIDLGDGKLAVALGDVSGKGVVASVLMTAALGYLHAALRQYGDPGKAVTALNRYIAPRRPDDRFITLWVGVLDSAARELRYVDAGHGYAVLVDQNRTITPIVSKDGLVLGIEPESEYVTQTLSLPPTGTILAMSDGIVEQPAARLPNEPSGSRREFDLDGASRAITSAPTADFVSALFAAVIAHAGTTRLADDATIVSVHWTAGR